MGCKKSIGNTRSQHAVEDTPYFLSPYAIDMGAQKDNVEDILASVGGEDATQQDIPSYEIPGHSTFCSPTPSNGNYDAAYEGKSLSCLSEQGAETTETPEDHHIGGVWMDCNRLLQSWPYCEGCMSCHSEHGEAISNAFLRSSELGEERFGSRHATYWRQRSRDDDYVWSWSAQAMDWELQMSATQGWTALAEEEN